jgi:hypothetical protein
VTFFIGSWSSVYRRKSDGLVGDLALVVEDQRRDGIQRIEQEVRVQLVPQHLHLGFLRECRGAQHRFALLLQRLVILDAEIQARPAQQQVGRAEGTDEDPVPRFTGHRIRFDPAQVRRVDDDAPAECDEPGSEQHGRDDHDEPLSPEAPIEVTQGRGEQETAGSRREHDLDVGRRLFIQERTQVLGDQVRAPAKRVQRPEEQVAVAAEVVESHRRSLAGRPRARERFVA